ncbi:MAG: metal-sensitive transcriptional regulator [Ferrimicrobium sp.]|uniref:metal-sensitive transcriptional regulator n=1 Tax=Ferrimicrobium acidiphilum TaxID=121039 RepID=UPI0023F2A6CE|nr:metal-sensitive transcriptional regulator [Ferrimicrobium acidiphilum]
MIPEYQEELLLRLKTIKGHLAGVIKMVEDERYCPDVMKQVAALQSSLERVNRILLRNHLETCVTEAIRTGNGSAKIDELLESLRFNSALTDFRHNGDTLGRVSEMSGETCESEAMPEVSES